MHCSVSSGDGRSSGKDELEGTSRAVPSDAPGTKRHMEYFEI